MKKEAYSLTEICTEIMEKYGLDSKSPTLCDAMRKKTIAVCKKIYFGEGKNQQSLWARSTQFSEGRKKPVHIFTESEKALILTFSEIQNYALARVDDPKKCEEFLENLKLAEEENRATHTDDFKLTDHMKNLRGVPQYTVSDEELCQKKIEIMIEALFLKFFTPINVTKLKADMELKRWASGGNETPESIAAGKRLQDGSNYYEELKPN